MSTKTWHNTSVSGKSRSKTSLPSACTAVCKCWKMCDASEFKLSSQQQSYLSMQWSHQQNSRGIEQTFTLIINQPLAAQPAQIAHTALPPLSLSLSVPHLPAAKYFGSSKVNLHRVNNHHHWGIQTAKAFEMNKCHHI